MKWSGRILKRKGRRDKWFWTVEHWAPSTEHWARALSTKHWAGLNPLNWCSCLLWIRVQGNMTSSHVNPKVKVDLTLQNYVKENAFQNFWFLPIRWDLRLMRKKVKTKEYQVRNQQNKCNYRFWSWECREEGEMKWDASQKNKFACIFPKI